MSDYSPVVAFCESRIETLKSHKRFAVGLTAEDEARIDELTMIVTLCRGLQKTDDMLRKQLGLVETI